jgi:hypothetical protein
MLYDKNLAVLHAQGETKTIRPLEELDYARDTSKFSACSDETSSSCFYYCCFTNPDNMNYYVFESIIIGVCLFVCLLPLKVFICLNCGPPYLL